MEEPKYSIEQIAARTGKPPAYVVGRLKLTELSPVVVEAFYREEIGVSHALLLAKLQPDQQETWTAVITGPDTKKAAAEMVAALYDRSLDAYLPHAWPSGFGVFREDRSNLQLQFENMLKPLQQLLGTWPLARKDVQMTYRSFPADITVNLWRYRYYGRGDAKGGGVLMSNGAVPTESLRRADGMEQAGEDKAAARQLGLAEKAKAPGEPGAQGPSPDLSKVSARKNLNETAFFFPHLISEPFRNGLHEAFVFAIVACLIAAAASWSRGGRYVHPAAAGDLEVEEPMAAPVEAAL